MAMVVLTTAYSKVMGTLDAGELEDKVNIQNTGKALAQVALVE
jgi:hypothetical protein